MRVTFHAGQLLQPVPGGIGRYARAMLDHLGTAGASPIAFAAGERPPGVPARVPWIDLGTPHGSMRYELWHRLRRPVVRIPADVVHAPSLAVPPVGRSPLVVTVHDIAFARIPRITTRRGAQFHSRGLELARRDATLILTPSEFTRRELEREGFAPDLVEVAAFGVDAPAPRASEEIDDTVAHAGVRRPYVLTVGTIEPRKDLPTLSNAVAQLARASSRSDACRRRPARLGRGLDARSLVRARARRAAVARRRRAVPARRRVLCGVVVRGLRAPRAGSDGARNSDDRDDRLRDGGVRTRRGVALRRAQRGRVRRRDRPLARRRDSP